MKNPFEKNDHKVLIAGIVIGSMAAGAAAYLFLTETGKEVRSQLSGHFNRLRDSFLSNGIEPTVTEDKQAYLKHQAKAPKTDREALHKHEILHESGSNHNTEEQSG